MKKLGILLPTTRLDIGGAETHVLELAKQLKEMGHHPIIISSGGIYTKELEKNDIPHHYAPLNNKRFSDLFESFKIFSRIIKKDKIDIIHAHGRIASLVSKIAGICYRIPFMTTAHALFDYGRGLRYLTFWGGEVIAISEDVKQHLIDKFGVKRERITIIENGIDTYAFSAHSKNADLIDELNLDKNSIKIFCVSRLSGPLADLVIQIIESISELNKVLGEVELVIVGDGDNYREVREISEQIDPMGKSIKILGKRTDIPEIMNIADVVVAVGRTALEAMAVEKPVILAGGEGYMGLLYPENYDLAKSTNFTGRNTGCFYTKEQFVNEIARLFNILSEEERKALGKFGRKKIEEQFSIRKMTEKTVKIYRKLIKNCRHLNVFLFGYYGFENTGDEAMLQTIVQQFRRILPETELTALTYKARDTMDKYGINAVSRNRFGDIINAIRKSDLVVSGGGSLLQDVTSSRSLLYYLAIIYLAKILGKKTVFYGNGFGPVNKPLNRKLAKYIINKVDIITVRDYKSKERLRLLGVRKDITVTADTTFSMNLPAEGVVKDIYKKEKIDTAKQLIGISVRRWYGEDIYKGIIAKTCENLMDRGYGVVFIPMQHPDDVIISREIAYLMGEKPAIIEGRYSPKEIAGIISKLDLLIGMRLHSLIFAAIAAVPMVGLEYDPKILSFLDSVGQESAGRVETLDIVWLWDIIDDVMRKKEEYKHRLIKARAGLRQKSELNIEILEQFVKKGE